MGIKARRGLHLVAIISVVGALLLSVGVISPKKAEADYCGWAYCPETYITSGPDESSSTTSNSATFGFYYTEQGATFQCQLSSA